jgi:hypothetical protein
VGIPVGMVYMARLPKMKHCIVCKKELGYFTRRKYCFEHMKERIVDVITQLKLKKGKIYRKYLNNWKRALSEILVKKYKVKGIKYDATKRSKISK